MRNTPVNSDKITVTPTDMYRYSQWRGPGWKKSKDSHENTVNLTATTETTTRHNKGVGCDFRNPPWVLPCSTKFRERVDGLWKTTTKNQNKTKRFGPLSLNSWAERRNTVSRCHVTKIKIKNHSEPISFLTLISKVKKIFCKGKENLSMH